MRPLLRALAPSAALSVLAACGTDSGSGRPCTEIGARVGVALEIAAPLAARTAHASMTVCDAGTCHTSDVPLDPSTGTRPGACSGDTCSGTVVPTGGSHGFYDIPGLPKRPVKVTVVLRDDGGRRVLDQALTVTPRGLSANGPGCGEGGPQAGVVAENGRLRERR
jgi:hypothetical protein